MSENKLKARLQHAIKTEAEWKSADPVLLKGEIAYSSDKKQWKTGDGTSKWSAIAYDKAIPTGHTHRDVDASGCFAYYGSDTANSNGWYKVYSTTLTGYGDHIARLSLVSTYSDLFYGVINIDVRSDNKTTLTVRNLTWESRQGFEVGDVIIVTNGNIWTLYVRRNCLQYGRIKIRVLESSAINSAWNMVLTNNTTKETTAPTPTVTAIDGSTVKYANSAGSVEWNNVKNKPSTFSPASHTHDDRYYTESEMDSKLGGKVDLSADGVSKAINQLSTASATPTDEDYYVSQYVGGGTTTTSYHRRSMKALWAYIQAKLHKVATSGSYNDLTNKPTIGNGTITIKQAGASKGTFTLNQTGNTTIELTDNNTNTWRGIQDNLTSTSTTDSLSANQGKVLNDRTYQMHSTQITDKVDFNTITSPGCYKVQMSAWGDGTTYHGPNTYNKDLYNYGLLTVDRALNDSENRIIQIYYPHKAKEISGTVVTRMNNGSTGWNAWTPLSKGIQWGDIFNKPTTFTPSAHNHDDSYLKLTGGTLTGPLNIKGNAASNPLKIRGIVGSDGNETVGDLYLQYGANSPLKLGNDGAYNISADGSTYSGKSATATKLATARKIDGVNFDGSGDIIHYGTCSTAAATAAKTVAVTGFNLVTGSKVAVKFTVTNTVANPTLNVNSTGAKAIKYRGSAISAGYLAANRVYEFIYDGTDYVLVGDLDTNTTYSAMTAATASAAGKSGLVPAPAAGKQGQYLRGDGTWATPTNTTYSDATQSTHGLMTADDKKKLDGIATGANAYTHPTSSGNKHIPSGGSSGQILRWSADGTAVWGNDNNTTYSTGTSSTSGITKLYTEIGSATDGTMTQAAIKSALDKKGDMVSSSLNSLTADAPNTSVIVPAYTAIASSPFSRDLWHDHFAFLQGGHVIKDNQVTTDGTTWVSDDMSLRPLFAQRETTSYTILSKDILARRFTLYGTQLSYSGVVWYEFGVGYTNPFSKFSILIESSEDGTTWTTVANANVSSNSSPNFLKGSSLGGNAYIRFTFTKINNQTTGSAVMTCIKGLTTRKGSQGLGIEYEKPYNWDYTRNIYPWKNGSQNLGTSSMKWNNVYANTFSGSLSGNASTSTKATQDSVGQQINTTYLKSLSSKNGVVTYTKGNNSTGTIDTQDNFITLTQSQYDTLVSSGKIDENCYYFITDMLSSPTLIQYVTLSVSGWTTSSDSTYYTQKVTAAHITANDNPMVIKNLSYSTGATEAKKYLKAFSILCSGVAETADGSVTWKVFKKPAIDISVGLIKVLQ